MSFIIALISAFHPMDCGPVDQGGGILSPTGPDPDLWCYWFGYC